MKKIIFTKMCGAGNDFIVIDRINHPSLNLSAEILKSLCNRRFGIGADGVIIIDKSDFADFDMLYYNADGSTGSLCGNGARCALKFAKTFNFFQKNKAEFISNGKKYRGEIVSENNIKFLLQEPQKIQLNFEIELQKYVVKASFADTGSPHVVVLIDEAFKIKNDILPSKNLESFPVFDLGREIRYNWKFAPDGANVNFLQIKNNRIFIRTYERGVEDETFACGTGAVASAIILHLVKNIQPPVFLNTKGGEVLEVNFENASGTFSNVSLSGPAKIVFSGTIELE